MKLALAQLDIAWEDKPQSKETAIQFIKQAADEKVDMILFPEMTLTGFSMNTVFIGDTNNETIEFFKKISSQFNILIGFGYVEGITNSKNNYSVVAPCGDELVNYTKIHPFSFGEESEFYQSGSQINTFNAFGFTIAPLICYDLRFPEIFQVASKTAHLITLAANWPIERRQHWITLLKARAIENQCYIAGINRVGEGNGLTYSGDSMIIDPLGNIISSLYMDDGLIIADICQENVTQIRENFRLKEDRKDGLYCAMYSDNI
ncbi:carbon-nitrogen family hydrolase [Clostridium bowmanii]|uniref:nitrilase-related carbon-nitrogen hydrolase n=1 Tax=Clostridium bowmanii TaxID=132925 RepID=UPI001C0D0EC7|nr:nitrilase-related carbon-nitrogen hydrolase [Clostridium bowmanii]MBU3188455.1 carbon-nitrogen family hydrolase [Clostridium bowmanii]MCA1072843.1 carbon-nitrogen family hydrolase [Clostridium bowmanii]